MFRIIGVHNHHFIRTGCGVCGQGFKLEEPIFLLRDDDDPEPGHFLDVCPDCAVLDADGLRERMQARMEDLRARADDLEEMLEEGIKVYDASDYPDTFCWPCGPVHGATTKRFGVGELMDAEVDPEGA